MGSRERRGGVGWGAIPVKRSSASAGDNPGNTSSEEAGEAPLQQHQRGVHPKSLDGHGAHHIYEWSNY